MPLAMQHPALALLCKDLPKTQVLCETDTHAWQRWMTHQPSKAMMIANNLQYLQSKKNSKKNAADPQPTTIHLGGR